MANGAEDQSQIPVLEASSGSALLHSRRTSLGPVTASRKNQNDPLNVVNYAGSVAAMAFSENRGGASRNTRAFSRSRPMPTSLVYELALNRAGQGITSGAIALVRNRFSQREGGTNVRQWGWRSRCKSRWAGATGHWPRRFRRGENTRFSVPGLSFTVDGLHHCSSQEQTTCSVNCLPLAVKRKRQTEGTGSPPKRLDASDAVWAWALGQKITVMIRCMAETSLFGFVTSGIERTDKHPPGWWNYSLGVLRWRLRRRRRAELPLMKSLLFPKDRMSHHFSAWAFGGATTPRYSITLFAKVAGKILVQPRYP